MSFLDRFKPQPRWKHADPVVRASAVESLPEDVDTLAVLEGIAAEDEDVRVRRAAGARIEDAAALVRLVRGSGDHGKGERDEELRRELTERLLTIATRPAASDGEAVIALGGIEDERQLATVATLSPHDAVRAAALARVQDVRALGSIARKTAFGQTALDAVGRIADQSELVTVAVKTEHKDAGLAALERAIAAIAPPAVSGGGAMSHLLDQVGTRAKNKSVAKRARTMMQAIEEAAAARRTAVEAWQQKVSGLVARVEQIAASPVTSGTAEMLAEAEADWSAVAAEQGIGGADGVAGLAVDGDLAARFTAAATQVRGALAEQERREAEQRAADAHRAGQHAAARSLVERLEASADPPAAVEGDAADALAAQIAGARAEWEGLEIAGSDADGAALAGRFEAACARVQQRHADRQVMAATHARLAALAAEAERLSGAASLQAPEWASVTAEWQALHLRSESLDKAVEAQYQQAEARVRQQDDDRKAAAERASRQQVQRLEQLIERAEKRTTAEDLTLREADRLARDLRAAVATVDAPLAGREQQALTERAKEQQALSERIRAASAALSPKLHELREMDEWKRFANAAVQEELIARAEALKVKYGFDLPEPPAPAAPEAAAPETAAATSSDLIGSDADHADGAGTEVPPASVPPPPVFDLDQAARELHDIQERWKSVAEAPRAQAQALWHRYRQAADPIQARLRTLFAARNDQRKGNLEKKLALIAQAEALAGSTDWVRTADALKKLQVEWQQIGPAPRQDTKATWKQFREACDRFFTRRNADLAERKETWSANLARKEALSARAEELAASRDWDRAAAEIRRLQAEWKTIGPVRRSKSEVVWQRFRAACDLFFDRYKRRDEIELESKQADREQLVAELEALGPAEGAPAIDGVDPAGLLEQVRSLRTRWNQSTPVVRHGADPLSARFVAALERALASHPEAFRGTELDVEPNRQKMEKLIARVEGFLAEAAPAPANSSQALASMLREALAANTIGGRAGEEGKWQKMAEEVRQAQASWSRLGPVPGEHGRALNERFHRATSRFFDAYRRKVPQQAAPARQQRPVATR